MWVNGDADAEGTVLVRQLRLKMNMGTMNREQLDKLISDHFMYEASDGRWTPVQVGRQDWQDTPPPPTRLQASRWAHRKGERLVRLRRAQASACLARPAMLNFEALLSGRIGASFFVSKAATYTTLI